MASELLSYIDCYQPFACSLFELRPPLFWSMATLLPGCLMQVNADDMHNGMHMPVNAVQCATGYWNTYFLPLGPLLSAWPRSWAKRTRQCTYLHFEYPISISSCYWTQCATHLLRARFCSGLAEPTVNRSLDNHSKGDAYQLWSNSESYCVVTPDYKENSVRYFKRTARITNYCLLSSYSSHR